MKKTINSVSVTLWANRLVAAVVFALLFALPALLDWYCQFRLLLDTERTAILMAFYYCAVVIFIALWNMDTLLRNIRKDEVFTRGNVRRIRVIGWCCGGVALICLPAALRYYPLIFIVLVMGFLFLAVSVVCRVMNAAVSIREENDLTI